MYVCMYIYTYTHSYVYIHCIYIYIHTYIYIYTYVCIYIHILSQLPPPTSPALRALLRTAGLMALDFSRRMARCWGFLFRSIAASYMDQTLAPGTHQKCIANFMVEPYIFSEDTLLEKKAEL